MNGWTVEAFWILIWLNRWLVEQMIGWNHIKISKRSQTKLTGWTDEQMFLHVTSAVMKMFLHLTSAAMQMIFAILKTSQHVISSSSTYMKKKKKEISTGFPIDIQKFLLSMIFGICTTTSASLWGQWLAWE